MHRVAITGVGIISALGNTPDAVSQSLYAGRSGIIVDDERVKLGFNSPLTGIIRDFDPAERLNRKQRKSMTEHAIHTHAAVMDALSMAALDPEDWQNEETGLVIGCDSSCIAAVEQTQSVKEHGSTERIGSGAVFRSMTSNVTLTLNTLLKTQGAAWTLSSACASGGHAVGQAAMLIATGQQQRMICGGAQEINWESMCSFDCLGAFASGSHSPEKACRPFDTYRTGLVPSGGAAALVLENYALAEARGATIYGEVCGYGFSSDGADISTPSASGLARAGAKALAMAGLSPRDIDYVCAHATATIAGDAAEAANLKLLFDGCAPVISSTKGMTGHELWMSGSSQAVYVTLMARDGFIAPNINLDRLMPEAEGLHVTPDVVERPPRIALLNAAGFGGTNSCLVLRF